MNNPFDLRGIHITHLNIRSLWNKIDVFRQQLLNSNIDCMTLSETWLNSNVPDNIISLPGYNLYRLDRQTINQATNKTKIGGGVAIYLKQEYECDSFSLKQQNLSNSDIEILWLSFKSKFLKPIIIAVVYRPPSGNITNFIDTLNISLESISNLSNNEIFILGDMNLDMSNSRDPNVSLFKNKMSRHNLIQDPTRFNNPKKGSTLDLIFTNSPHINHSGTGSWNLSDHELIFATRKQKSKTKQRISFTGRSYRNYSQIDFQNDIINLEWNYFFTIKNPELAWKHLINKIEPIIDNYCPSKTYNITNIKDPWITNELLEMIHDKDYFLKKAKKNGDIDDWRIARNLRNQTKLLVKNAKIDFIKEQLEENKNDSKKFWRNIKIVLPDSNTGKQIFLHDETNTPIPETETANYINEFFTSIGPKLARKDISNYQYSGQKYPSNFSLNEVTSEEVLNLAKGVNITKSSALDGISSRILRDIMMALPDHFTYIFNLSIQYSSFPDSWKIANVIPIPKEGNPRDVNNYRPISLLPLPGKILKKIICKQIIS